MDVKAKIGVTLALFAAAFQLPACAQAEPGAPAAADGVKVLKGVTSSGRPDTVYAPVRDLGKELGWPVHWEAETQTLYLNHKEVPREERGSLPDGTRVIPVRQLEKRNATVTWNREERKAKVQYQGQAFQVEPGRKTVMAGITFAEDPGTLYAPVRELGRSLGWTVHWDAEAGGTFLNGKKIPDAQVRQLADGTKLVDVRGLEGRGAAIAWNGARQTARITRGRRATWVQRGEKRVAVNRETQQMRAWQGDLLVLDTRVSTGRSDKPTPTGTFTAGPLKTPMLISRTYDDAQMPWSVQIRGDYVIHGFPSVPPRAASHGCVRVPLTGANPAKWFYQWVDVGTPIIIQDRWPEDSPA